MDGESKVHNCDQCEYIRIYDYGKRLYYCDHVDRIDDMGKLGVGGLPKESPGWCPRKVLDRFENGSMTSDLIKMKIDIELTDINSNPQLK